MILIILTFVIFLIVLVRFILISDISWISINKIEETTKMLNFFSTHLKEMPKKPFPLKSAKIRTSRSMVYWGKDFVYNPLYYKKLLEYEKKILEDWALVKFLGKRKINIFFLKTKKILEDLEEKIEATDKLISALENSK